ncbi:hypothetical protein Zmor_018887 [Zophobas morio]|uniref:Peptidase S1 domain-containing protein n=1 Tax=Zophobas morio TaxID=2755281 RepID=A0AA38IAU1_9CUCU|nr:hypothetical protein Zmor_018887 [Zophobas morio]
MIHKLLLFLTLATALSLPRKEFRPRIFNGEPASKGQFPWQAALWIPTNTGLKFCGGSLISDTWVLTSANCVGKAFFRIRVLLGTLESTGDDPDQVELHSRLWIIHENFNPWTYENDVAVVRLPEAVVFNDYIQPIALMTEDVDEDSTVTVSGWGAISEDDVISSDLTYSNLTISTSCAGTDSTICAIPDGNSDSQNICLGDIGDALVLNAFTDPVQVGIASSYGTTCNKGGSGIFTSTAFERQWIKRVTDI